MFSKRELKPLPSDKLVYEILYTQRELSCAWQKFDLLIDPDLIEGAIYEINSITSQYSYLMSKAKANGISNPNYLQGHCVGGNI